MSVTLSEPVADVVAAVGKLRAYDGLVTDTGRQLNEIEAMVDVITVLESVLVDRVDEARKVEATAEHYGRSPRGWLTEDLLMAGPEASRYVNLGKALADFPLIADAFRSARVSTAHVNEMVKALRWVPIDYRDAVEPALVEFAFTARPEQIAAFVEDLLTALGLDKASDARRESRYAEREFAVGQTMDGRRNVAGTLMPEVGEKLEKALALASGKAGEEDTRTLLQRQHDAIGDIADAYLATAGAGEPNCKGAPRTVIITMPLETLENQLRDQWLRLPDGAQISAETARRLACDAGIVPVVLGSSGEILDIGKLDHEFTVAQRRAAWYRDGGKCAFPGCCNRPAQLHHIIWRRHHGPTSLDNAAWLCILSPLARARRRLDTASATRTTTPTSGPDPTANNASENSGRHSRPPPPRRSGARCSLSSAHAFLPAGGAVDQLAQDVGVAGMPDGLAGHVGDDPAGGVPLVVLGRDRHPLVERLESGDDRVAFGDGLAIFGDDMRRVHVVGHGHLELVVVDTVAGELVAEPIALGVDQVPDQAEERGAGLDHRAAQFFFRQAFGLLDHAVPGKREEGERGVGLTVVVAWDRFALCLSHSGQPSPWMRRYMSSNVSRASGSRLSGSTRPTSLIVSSIWAR